MSITFGYTLERILIDRDMTQTDLARLAWNETYVDKRGYEVVAGKDRISSYINGRQLPSRRNYQKLLEVLKLTEDQLPLKRSETANRATRRINRIEELEKEIARLIKERDHWKDTSQKMADLALTLAKANKERGDE
jgi:transcriptional regulator with XRE-family HTH domain